MATQTVTRTKTTRAGVAAASRVRKGRSILYGEVTTPNRNYVHQRAIKAGVTASEYLDYIVKIHRQGKFRSFDMKKDHDVSRHRRIAVKTKTTRH